MAAEIIYIENGGGTIYVDDRRYDAEHGDIFIVPPDTAHAIAQDGDRAEYLIEYRVARK